MRFTPITFMASRGECLKAYSNGSISGSFESGSRLYAYHEFKLNTTLSTDFTFVVESGYTTDARVIVIGGGGGGGWNPIGTLGVGGGGGGADVIDTHNVVLTPSTYTVRVGRSGIPADSDTPSPLPATYNGGDGDYSTFSGTTAILLANGGEGGIGFPGNLSTYLYGGNSGNGFLGGAPDDVVGDLFAGGGAGCTENGDNGVNGKGGNGGNGKTIVLPYTSPTWNATTMGVGGGGSIHDPDSSDAVQGFGVDGGGRGSKSYGLNGVSGTARTGGGGGGGASFAYTPPNGLGTTGGDGFVIIYYPITGCFNEGSSSFQTGSSLLNACTSPTTKTLYYDKFYYTNLEVGSVLYNDKALLSPVSNSYIVSGSQIYVINGSNGVVTSTTICSNTVSMASGSIAGAACVSTTFNNYYYTGSLIIGTKLYTDYGRTNLVPNNFYKKSGTVDIYNTNTGIIDSIATCSIDCKTVTFNGGGSGGTISFYDCTNTFGSATMNRLNVFTTCVNVNAPITTTGTTSYTTGSAC